jgi:basic membrane lipoprotein Med (substrate-binding protein (PBP1-ABC) superfamily)
MPHLDEDAQTRRRALLIATSQYEDVKLRGLRAPGKDAEALRTVLADPAIGRYDVQTVLNERLDKVQRTILEFCQDAHPHELLLLYLSCHGILDDHGRLYYATLNTEYRLLEATALPADWLNQRLATCRARRQILILDCCHSGAFGDNGLGVKGEADLALHDRFGAHGRVVFTASRGTEYSFEGGVVTGEGTTSVFTKALVDGLQTGDADRDQDGLVSASELYGHVFDRVHEREPRQTPRLWTYGSEGDLLVAWNPHGAKPVPLPADLIAMVDSPRLGVREAAVAELAGLLDEAEPRLMLTARNALDRRAEDDVPRVTALARAALAADKGRARQAVEAARTLVVDRGPQAPPAVPTPVEDRAPQAPPAVPTPAEDRGRQAPRAVPVGKRRRRLRLVVVGSTLAAVAAAVVVALVLRPDPFADFAACMVGVGGDLNNEPSRQTWDGLQQLNDDLGMKNTYETPESDDYQETLESYASSGQCDVVVPVSGQLADETSTAAQDYAQQHFAIVDTDNIDAPAGNVKPITFDRSEAAVLAGYVAAAASRTEKVATLGLKRACSYTIVMEAFKQGVDYYNEEQGKGVEVLRWEDGRPGDGLFTQVRDAETVRTLTEDLIDEGADVIMPIVGSVSSGAAEAAASAGNVRLVWYDPAGQDGYDAVEEKYRPLLLTSVVKDIAAGVYDAVRDIAESAFTNDRYIGTLANDGVRLGKFHDDVPADLDENLTALEDRINAGDVWADPSGNRCPS